MARVLGFDPATDALYTDNLDVEFEMDAVGWRGHQDETRTRSGTMLGEGRGVCCCSGATWTGRFSWVRWFAALAALWERKRTQRWRVHGPGTAPEHGDGHANAASLAALWERRRRERQDPGTSASHHI